MDQVQALGLAGPSNSYSPPNGTHSIDPAKKRDVRRGVPYQTGIEDSDEDDGDDAENALVAGSLNPSSTPELAEYSSQDEITALRCSQNRRLRQLSNTVHPASKEDQERIEHAPPDSAVDNFQQMYRGFVGIYLEAYRKSSTKTSRTNLFGESRCKEMKRCGLSEEEMVKMGLKSIPWIVQNHYGGPDPFDTKGLASFPPCDRAYYRGGYVGFAFWRNNSEDKVAIYHGQTVATLAGRVETHRKRIAARKGKDQSIHAVFRKAKNQGGSFDFRITHISGDETPNAVITMNESFFMLMFGRVQAFEAKDGVFPTEVQQLIKELRGNLSVPEDWIVVNNRLPTKERAH